MSSYWASLVTKFGFGPRARSVEAEYERSRAYKAVFSPRYDGHATDEQKQIVLADLMAKSGFSAVTPPSASDAELRQQEGKRELFADVFAYVNLSPEDMHALANAARKELALDNTQQEGF